MQRIQAAWGRAEQIGELWLTARPDADRVRFSAYVRRQARLASMPVIEQAKGIMAQYGWPEDQALDALRRASQRYNIKVRDPAAKIAGQDVRSTRGRPVGISAGGFKPPPEPGVPVIPAPGSPLGMCPD